MATPRSGEVPVKGLEGVSMDVPRPDVSVEPGPGIVLRRGAVVVLLAATPDAARFEAELSAALAPWAGNPAPAPGDALRALVTLLITHRGRAPGLGAAVQDGADLRLLLHGAVRAQVSGPAGERELSGRQAATWVDHLLTNVSSSIRITLEGGRDGAWTSGGTGLPGVARGGRAPGP